MTLEYAGLPGFKDLYRPELLNSFLLLDAVMVSLDFEGFDRKSWNTIKEVGIATFNTRELFGSASTKTAIKSQHYCDLSHQMVEFHRRACLFTTPERIHQSQIKDVIERSIVMEDASSPGRLRRIIMVSQSVDKELTS